MKICSHCGSEMESKRIICDNCGWGEAEEYKRCKYCQSSISAKAKVCPNCKRGLTWTTNHGVLAFLLIIVVFIIWGISSNNAPLFIRKTVCTWGIRDDFPYCYYIDTDKPAQFHNYYN